MKTQKFTLHGVTYEAPGADVEAAVSPEQGRLFVRLAPPGADFHLILDEWNDLPSHQGPKVPRISRLNDVRFQEFTVIEGRSGPVVCTDRQPHFNCGFSIEDGPVRWSVLFDQKHLPRSEELRAEAEARIQAYRSGHADRR
jgi:hypothetical protein